MNPKPVKERRKAIIHSSMWAPRGRRFWTFHNEEKIYFHSCGEARQWASKHKFDGVRFTTQEEDNE